MFRSDCSKGEHIGMLGANGEGKSTFMSVITGKLLPDAGKVEWARNVKGGYLDSARGAGGRHDDCGCAAKRVCASVFHGKSGMNAHLAIRWGEGTMSDSEMETAMEEVGTDSEDLLMAHDFYLIDSKVDEIARAFELTELGLDRDVSELVRRAENQGAAGKTLAGKTGDFWLLDEPTNYLDTQHIEWLQRYLQEYENAFILISHDIPFLNSVVNVIYHVENKKIDRYPGDYAHFEEVYAAKKAQLEAAYKRRQQEKAQLEDFVARNKARVSTRNMAMSRQKKLDKMEMIELAAEKPKPEFSFKSARASGKLIFETRDLVIGYDEPLSNPIHLTMERGERLVLKGGQRYR